ncbi:potassium channel subfamily K member 16 [Callorhinchus milii]|uniref:Potassium channel subfamily K member 16-like n=2 Tax=Callorhinchus milii TaxID=7868 RepID=A0A4W3GHC1_CALMI|nr:potassium channel subfamily K member 16 [Callorhinchus milii]|eukprot:gi/632951815/ref/XP_007891507.1/ PREDICTED: potassium channel subfamily K member 16-like [Callorhinchus milii]
MIEALKHGVNPIGNSSTSAHSNWDFSSSFFFVTTVVTTIGYGNLSPSTAGGQIVCVFYALFGIPLNLVVLGLVGKHLSSHVENMRTCLANKGFTEKTLKVLTFSLSLLIGVLVFLLIPPLVFSAVEGWSYRESIYYSFITLSTIGFGDYVIGTNPLKKYKNFYRGLVTIWILFGMAWLAFLFNLLTIRLENTEKKITKMKKTRKAAAKKGGEGETDNECLDSISLHSETSLNAKTELEKGAIKVSKPGDVPLEDLKILAAHPKLEQKETKSGSESEVETVEQGHQK